MKSDDFRKTSASQINKNSTVHQPYLYRRNVEKKLMAFLALGNPELLAEHLENDIHKTHDIAINRLADAPLTQAKYQGIALTNLACRTAMAAGVAEKTASAICDTCFMEYDTMTDPARQWEIAKSTLLRFCEAIHTTKLSGYSGAVRQCCEYIHSNLYGSISLDELGQVCHLSPHYVSDLFRKELGIGALQYVHQEKMQYAKFLLENSDQGIAEIASLLSYPSHSNFSHRFKKFYGITPHEFRVSFGR